MKKICLLAFILFGSVSFAFSQKNKSSGPAKTSNNVIFAVLNGGKSLEPVAKIVQGKLVQSASGSDEKSQLVAFTKTNYKASTVYDLIFGGNVAGTVTVIKNDPNSDCAATIAEVTTKSTKAQLKGSVMALATKMKLTKTGSGVRRAPTATEKADIEKLVAAEFVKNKAAAPLKFLNLSALDVDNDGSLELVGSYWAATNATTRALLFFIAAQNKENKYSLSYKEFRKIKQDEVMNTDIKTVDTGIYHERLLDIFDYNDDGVAEIFTYTQGFEGASFTAYQRKNGTWAKVLESSNYHCAF